MKKFIKEKYNILIPIFLIIVILIAVFLYAREYKNNRYAKTEEVDVYQYFSGLKLEYKAKISRNKKNVILKYEPKDEVVNLSSIPIYIKGKDNVIFPKAMSIIFPIKDEVYSISSLAEVYKKNNLYYLNQKNINTPQDHAFYYDGIDLYFFPEATTIEVGSQKIELSPMSYLNCSYQSLLEYYDKANDNYGKIDLTDENVIVSNDYYKIDVTLDKVIYQNSFRILDNDFSSLPKINDKENK